MITASPAGISVQNSDLSEVRRDPTPGRGRVPAVPGSLQPQEHLILNALSATTDCPVREQEQLPTPQHHMAQEWEAAGGER